MQNRDTDGLLAPNSELSATSSNVHATNTVITDSESDSQVPCWRGAKACFCTLRRYLLVAICDILIVTVLCVTLVEPRWLMIHQGQCRINGHEGKYIGVDFFFSRGVYRESRQEIVFRYGENKLVNCLNAAAVTIFRCAVTLVICCIFLTLVSFCFCIVKLRVQLCLVIRKYAVFNIVTAIICGAVLVLIFCASDEVSNIQQRRTRVHKETTDANNADIDGFDYLLSNPYALTDFSTGYYLILLAAFLSLVAVGITLIDCACYHTVFSSSRHSTRGYERLISSSGGSSSNSENQANRRTVFAVPVSTRVSHRSQLVPVTLPDTSNTNHSTPSGLLPPPPPYSATATSNNANPSAQPANSNAEATPQVEANLSS